MPDNLKELADLGGWVAFLVVTVWGGRAGMSLARSFATDVVVELRAIKDAIGEQRSTLAQVMAQLDRLENHKR